MKCDFVPISDIANINDRQYSSKEQWSTIHYLDTGNVTKGRVGALQVLNALTDKVPSRARRKVKDSSIVYSLVRPNQQHYALLKEPPNSMLVSTGFAVIDADKSKVLPRYLYYALTTKEATSYFQTLAEQSVSTYPTLGVKDLASFKICLPDIDTQKQVSSILGTLDKKMNLNYQINDYLLELATVRFEQALISESDTFRFSELVELEDSKREPLNSRDRETRKGIYPYYGATSIMDYIDDYLFDGIRVLVGEDGTVIQEDGKPVLQYVWGKYWVNNHAHVLRSKSDYSLEAIYIALARTAISHIVTGAVQMKISQKNLNNLELEMPQPSSLRYLEDIFTLYRKSTEESKMLERLRDLLLPRLMSGEIDVSKIDITQLNNHLPDC